MRTKLTDIISTMDEYNWGGRFCSEYDDGDEVEIDTDVDDAPETITIKEMLALNPKPDRLNERAPYVKEYVKSFDQFINEINQSTYTTTQSYFGCLDDSDDLGEEE